MKLYIDTDYKVHTVAGDGLTEIETDVFDGKCAAYIEGYRFIPPDETWEREDGTVISNGMLAPWQDSRALDEAQSEYEQEQLVQYESALSEIETALGVNT